MSFWSGAKIAGRGGGRLVSRGFGFWAKWGITGIILGVMLVNAIIISVQSEDISEGIDYLGKKLLNPLLKLQEESIRIYENQGLVTEDGTKPTIFETIGIYWNFLTSLYIIMLWLIVIQKIFHAVLGDNIPKIVRYSFSFITFSAIQVFYLQQMNLPINTVWKAWVDIIKATPYLFNKLSEAGEVILGQDNITINSSI